jgi:hypothetical protein
MEFLKALKEFRRRMNYEKPYSCISNHWGASYGDCNSSGNV